jgi:hypothetical protein
VQLKRKGKTTADLRRAIAKLSIGIVAAGSAGVGTAQAGIFSDNYFNDSTGLPDLPYTQIDSAVLVYQEAGGRVQATEPTFNLTANGRQGQQLTLNITADTVTGATPNGAAPSDQLQTFVTPLRAKGSKVTVTSASGGSTVIQLPPTPGQIAQAAFGRQYTVAANSLPVDRGFYDERKAGSFGWSQPLGPISQIGFGAGYSEERDYRAITANARVAQNFNSNNSTLSLAVNLENDSSFPYGGIPTPLSAMSATWKSPSSNTKNQVDILAGLTEVMSRRWLMQLNYQFGSSSGYQNDPYRILSVVDQTSGEPLEYVYESRPGNRTRQSLYLDNRIDFAPAVTDVSFRYYRDSWGISAETAELSERLKLTSWLYVEPNVRWYHQSAASFFHYYLTSGAPLPAYASSDSRLGSFTAVTYGGQIGINLTRMIEVYVRGAYYKQTGNGHPSNAVGQLAQQNLFSGVQASWVMAGVTWDFH